MKLIATVERKTIYTVFDANRRPVGEFLVVENWCGFSKLVCEAGPLKGEEIVALTPDPSRPKEPLEIVKASPNAVDTLMAFSPAG